VAEQRRDTVARSGSGLTASPPAECPFERRPGMGGERIAPSARASSRSAPRRWTTART